MYQHLTSEILFNQLKNPVNTHISNIIKYHIKITKVRSDYCEHPLIDHPRDLKKMVLMVNQSQQLDPLHVYWN